MKAIKRCSLGAATLLATALTASANEAPKNPTFTKDIAPIFNANCVQCHRPGDIGPMSLMTYEEARPWAKSIRKNVENRVMPPWHADPAVGQFKNDRRLQDWEVDTIVNWVKQGAKQGDPTDQPAAPDVTAGTWRLGEPDVIVDFREVSMNAGGPDKFYDLTGKTGIEEDTWIRAIEVLPGNRKIVHHVIIWQGGQSGRGWLGAWAAGMDPMVFPEGTGRKLKAGVPLVADMHYHPADTPETDQTKIGLYLAKDEDIEKELINLWIQNASFEIPAGDPEYKARANFTFQQDSYLMAFLPHMHYRGKKFTYTARFPDGKKQELLRVNEYDFNWQTGYEVNEPIFVPKGTRIDCVAVWDNSAENPDNPDPTRTVRNGDESYDEMMIGFVDYVVAEGRSAQSPEEVIAALAKEMHAKSPGDVYRVDVLAGGEGVFLGAVELPRDRATGTWHINLMGSMREVPVQQIAWNGDAVTAKMEVLGQQFNLEAEVDATGKVTGRLAAPGEADNDVAPIRGERVTE